MLLLCSTTFPLSVHTAQAANYLASVMNRPSDGLTFLNRQLKLDSREDAEDVASQIEECPRLGFLELRGNTIGVKAGERIAEALEKHPELKFALWSDLFTGRLKNEIPPILRSMCGSMMRVGTCLTELDLSDNAFGPIGAEGIQDFLCSPSAFELKTLRLNNNGLGAGGVIIANCLLAAHRNAAAAGRKFALKTFVAGRNRLEDPGAKALANAFKTIGTLEEITVPQNGIRKDGIEALAECLGANKSLRVINFNDNTATRNGAIAIAFSLGDLKQLEVLDLGDCLCRANGTTAILSVLVSKPFPALREVNLSGNELPVAVVRNVLGAWSRMQGGTKLRVTNNGFGGEWTELAEEIEKRALADRIDLGNESDDEGTASEEEVEESDEEERRSRQGSEEDENKMGAGDPLAGALGRMDMQQPAAQPPQQQQQQPQPAAPPAAQDSSDGEKNSDDDSEEDEDEEYDEDEDDDSEEEGELEPSADSANSGTAAATSQPSDGLSFLNRQLKLDSREDAEDLASQIEACPRLGFLELRGNTIGIQAGERIAEALAKHPELKFALWSDLFTGRLKNEIPPILRSMCGSMMRVGTCLTELDLSDNAFGPIGAEGIQDFLCSPSAFELKTLRLNNNGLGAGGVIIANCLLAAHRNAAAAGRKFALKTFVAGRNRLEDPGAKALAEAFKTIGTLEEIAVPQNGIRKDGIKALASCLGENKSLRVINFNDNTATRSGALAIAAYLGDLSQLEVLDLGDCLCRASGTECILSVLVGNPFFKLREVNLSGNELPVDVVRDVLGKWNRLPDETKLRVTNNGFGGEWAELAEEIQNRALADRIDLGNESDDEGTASEEEYEETDEETDDEEERMSRQGSEEEDDDSEEEGELERSADSAKENSGPAVSSLTQQLQQLSLQSFCGAPSVAGLRALATTGTDRLKQMIEPFASTRDQTESARLFLSVVVVASADRTVEREAVEVIDTLLVSVAAHQRRPIPTTVQLMNHVVAHVDDKIKREENLVALSAVSRPVLESILRTLIQRGRLGEARSMIGHYFPSTIAAAAASAAGDGAAPAAATPARFNFSFGAPAATTTPTIIPKFSFGK